MGGALPPHAGHSVRNSALRTPRSNKKRAIRQQNRCLVHRSSNLLASLRIAAIQDQDDQRYGEDSGRGGVLPQPDRCLMGSGGVHEGLSPEEGSAQVLN
jgi:hypothetical protein